MSVETFGNPFRRTSESAPSEIRNGEKVLDLVETIETHGGRFHLDEMLAVAVLKDLFHNKAYRLLTSNELTIAQNEEDSAAVREKRPSRMMGPYGARSINYLRRRIFDSSDPRATEVLEEARNDLHRLLLDKGHDLNPGKLNIDHHQGGVSRSTAGLVWSLYGEAWLRSMSSHHPQMKSYRDSQPEIRTEQLAGMWERINQKLFILADAQDVGELHQSKVGSVSVANHTLARVVGVANRPRTKKEDERTAVFVAETENLGEYMAALLVRESEPTTPATVHESYRTRISKVLGTTPSTTPSDVWRTHGAALMHKASVEARKILGTDVVAQDAFEKSVGVAQEKIASEYWEPIDTLAQSNAITIQYSLGDGTQIESNEFDQFAYFSALPRGESDAEVTKGAHPKFEEFMIRYATEALLHEYGETQIDKSKLSLSPDGCVLIYESNTPIIDCDDVLKNLISRPENTARYGNVVLIVHKNPLRSRDGLGNLVHDDDKSYYWLGTITDDTGGIRLRLPAELRGLNREMPEDAKKLDAFGLRSVRFVSQTGHVAQVGNLEDAQKIIAWALGDVVPQGVHTFAVDTVTRVAIDSLPQVNPPIADDNISTLQPALDTLAVEVGRFDEISRKHESRIRAEDAAVAQAVELRPPQAIRPEQAAGRPETVVSRNEPTPAHVQETREALALGSGLMALSSGAFLTAGLIVAVPAFLTVGVVAGMVAGACAGGALGAYVVTKAALKIRSWFGGFWKKLTGGGKKGGHGHSATHAGGHGHGGGHH